MGQFHQRVLHIFISTGETSTLYQIVMWSKILWHIMSNVNNHCAGLLTTASCPIPDRSTLNNNQQVALRTPL